MRFNFNIVKIYTRTVRGVAAQNMPLLVRWIYTFYNKRSEAYQCRDMDLNIHSLDALIYSHCKSVCALHAHFWEKGSVPRWRVNAVVIIIAATFTSKKNYCRNKQRVGAKQLQVFHTCSSPAYSLTIVFWSLYVLIHMESVLVGALHAHLRNNSYISRSFLWQNSSRDHWSEWMSTLLWSL